MKQTSLIQSWTRAFKPSVYPRQETNAYGNSSGIQKDREDYSNDAFDSNSSDVILTNALDQFNAAAIDQPITTLSHLPNEAPNGSEQIMCDLLRNRKPISYRPTANDSSQLDGFDLDAGRVWIYPLNAPLREYQFNIAEQCLYKNTLVCLPTGLGKTFIAAVVLYNFLRWYPTGKAVFMAPTRPLVAQQLTACRQLTNLAPNSMVEFTGSIAQSKRRELWSRLRSFFVTPQVLVNDLEADVCPATDLRLLVFDEAHKATGNHAYCQVLRLLTSPPHMHRQFRIVALSATPAADIQGVQTLIANLLIAHLEMRTETSIDVKQFTQTRQLETIVVPLGPELRHFQHQLIACARTPIERLRMRGAFVSSSGDLRPERLAKYTVVKAREEWATSSSASTLSPLDASAVQCNFGVLICLLHAMELLEQHGLRPLYQYLAGVLTGQRASPSVRAEMTRLPGVTQLWTDLDRRFDGALEEFKCTQSPFHGGHPKLDKLKQILCEHFQSKCTTETRVIVFSQFRDSVEEIMHMLKQLRPLIRPACFMGQSSGAGIGRSPSLSGNNNTEANSPGIVSLPSRPITGSGGVSQRDQLRVMNAFREGVFNTLVSTCVGEEGLDVGQVDLIVCFDAFKSPIRLVQRLGRTGRRRLGRIVMLLTEGREERNHQVSMARSTSIHKALLEGGAYKRLAFYPHNPRMVPIGLDPQVQFHRLQYTPLDCDQIHTIPFKKTLTKRNFLRSSKMNSLGSKTDDCVRSHVEALGLRNIKLNLTPLGPSPLHFLNFPTSDVAKPYFTVLFDTTGPDRLNATRERLQAYRSVGSKSLGPATSTLHLFTTLRLCELHRRGLTRLSYHALGLRSVDVVTPLTHLITGSDPVVTDAGETSVPMEERLTVSSEVAINEKVTTSPVNPTQPSLVSDKPMFPASVRGLVSAQFFFNPNLDINARSIKDNFVLWTKQANCQVAFNNLEYMWTEHRNNVANQFPVCAQPHTFSPPIAEVTSVANLEQWLDTSLLEVINSPFNEKSTERSPSCVSCRSTAADSSPHITANCTRTSLAAAFCLRSPKDMSTANLVARSTPCVKPRSHRCAPVPSESGVGIHSQIRLEDALALLDRSTVRLDTTALLIDEPMDAGSNATQIRSAVFTGQLRHSYPDELQFGTKLSLGEDFGEDMLLSSQAHPQTNGPTCPVRYSSSESQSPELISSFQLPEQISWSPVTLEQEDSRSQVINLSSDGRTSPSINRHSEMSESLDSPLVPLRHRANKSKNARILLQTQSDTVNSIHFESGRRFLLTQAKHSGSHSREQDSESQVFDGYESSFIDDGTTQMDYSDGGDASGCLNKSEMLAVYLQSIRSPPPTRDNKLVPYNCRCHPKESPPTTNRPLYSQSIQRDSFERMDTLFADLGSSGRFTYSQTLEKCGEYELISSFVNSTESTPTPNPEKRRRISRVCR